MRRYRGQYNDSMKMLWLALLVVLGLGTMSPSGAALDRKAAKKACAEVKQKIRRIESRMRAGYTAAQGIRLEARLKKLKDKRYRVCR